MGDTERLRELFVGREDVFAQQHEDGAYTPVGDYEKQDGKWVLVKPYPLTDEDLFLHLRGDCTIGTYTTRPEDNTVKTLCFDVDTKPMAPVQAIISVLQEYGVTSLQYLVEFSGRKGHHVWLFMPDWQDAGLVRLAGLAVLQQAGFKCEVFPKQAEVGAGYGNLIKLPLGKHQVSGQWSKFVGGCNPWNFVRPLSIAQLVGMAADYRDIETADPVTASQLEPGELTPTMRQFMEEEVPQGDRNNAIFRFALTCRRHGKDRDEATELALEKNKRCVPPLPPSEVRRTVRSAYSY